MVAGYVPSSTSPAKAIGSLVLGYYEDGKLIHAGQVGTGYTAAMAEDLYQRLERIRLPSSPFAERLSADAARQVRYVKPQLVAEVSSTAGRATRICATPRSVVYARTDVDARHVDQSSPGAAPGGDAFGTEHNALDDLGRVQAGDDVVDLSRQCCRGRRHR